MINKHSMFFLSSAVVSYLFSTFFFNPNVTQGNNLQSITERFMQNISERSVTLVLQAPQCPSFGIRPVPLCQDAIHQHHFQKKS